MPDALIVAHGQPSDPDPAEADLAAFAERVQRRLNGLTLGSATLAAPGRLEAALTELAENGAIYPLFMAKGWFVTDALPKRIGAHPATLLDPLGTDPDLPALVADTLRAEITQRSWDLAGTGIFLAAHGSGRSRNPARVATAFAGQVCTCLGVEDIPVGFVEEPPSIEQVARGFGARSLCLPVFARPGGHASDDVPEALEAAGFAGALLPVLGDLPGVPALIADRLTAHAARVQGSATIM